MKIKIKKQKGITTISSKLDRCTIAYRKLGETVEFAVSYCHPVDKWKRKEGLVQARAKLESSICVTVPLPSWWDENALQKILLSRFSAFTESI